MRLNAAERTVGVTDVSKIGMIRVTGITQVQGGIKVEEDND